MTDSSSREKSRYCYILNLGLITILLSACGDPGMADLKKYVAEIKAKKNPHVEKMPEYRHIPPYFYEVQNLRDPFIALIDTKKRGDISLGSESSPGGEKKACPSPQSHRIRVGLELMPLDALQLVGTLEIDGTLWALVKSTGDGAILPRSIELWQTVAYFNRRWLCNYPRYYRTYHQQSGWTCHDSQSFCPNVCGPTSQQKGFDG